MAIDNFAVFILTHGRPHNVKTYKTLRKQGYTGPIYIIIDNEDKTAIEYRKQYGDQVIMFDKAAIAETFDEGDNFQDRRAVIYARNASFEIARALGIEYFLQLDDDYTSFRHKSTADLAYMNRKDVKSLDRLFESILEFFKAVPAVTVAMGQGGDFVGGKNGTFGERLILKRKAMNTFFCSISRPFQFFGRINEDVNAYVLRGMRGELFLTFFNVGVQQDITQQNTGGMSEMYLDSGTYTKSFYTVMYAPSCVKIGEIGVGHKRLHHSINWNAAVPCILSEQYRKA